MTSNKVMQPSLPFTLHTKKAKMMWLLLLSCVFVAGGVLMVLKGKQVGWLCGGFFALGIPIFLIQLHPRASYLTIEKDGFEFCALFRKTRYRWAEIAGFGTYTIRQHGMPAGTFVGLNFSPEYHGAPKMRAANKALVGFEGGLPDTYGMKADDLALLLGSYHAENTRMVSSRA
jgi:hypothetical protein